MISKATSFRCVRIKESFRIGVLLNLLVQNSKEFNSVSNHRLCGKGRKEKEGSLRFFFIMYAIIISFFSRVLL